MSRDFRPVPHELPLSLPPMTDEAAHDWLATPLGRSVLETEARVLQESLADVFGFETLQVGRWGEAAELSASARTQHHRCVAPDARGKGAIRASYDALPIATGSVEAVLLPHTLEHAADPHGLLNEVERVLRGDGHLVICGFNPLGPWGVRHMFARRHPFPPPVTRLLTDHRIRDWLRLLRFEIVTTTWYLFAPPWTRRTKPDRTGWLDRRGPELFPPLAGAYLVKARKRVRAMTPIRPLWQRAPAVVGGLAEPTSRNAA
jgi:SAM-dependent methyltransferase